RPSLTCVVPSPCFTIRDSSAGARGEHQRRSERRGLPCAAAPILISSRLTCRLWRHGRAHATDVLSTPRARSAPRVGARNDGHQRDERETKPHRKNLFDHCVSPPFSRSL